MIRSLTALAMTLGVCLGNAACAGLPVSAEGPLPAAVRSHPESFIVVTVRNDTAPVAPRAGSTMRGYDGAARYTVGNNARSAVTALATAHHLREVSSWPIAALGIHCIVFELPANETAAQMIERLRHDARVETVQPLNAFATQSTHQPATHQPATPHPSTTYNDPYQGLQVSLVKMNVLPAHRWSRGAGVRVAIIDTGVDSAHPDLAGRIAERRNFVDDDDWTFNHDRHGTAVAGVIAADSNNRIGIVGVAPEARLYVYKACWQLAGAHEGAACNTFTLAKALAAAIDARVQIVNLSLSGPEDSLLTRLVARGQQQGIIFVGAASAATDPSASAKSQAGFPGGINGVITVAAIEHHRTESGVLLAPGAEVLTLVPEGHYDFISGSSLAAANVSGAIALLKARDRTLMTGQLKQLLTTTSRNVATGDTTETAVDACAALGALLKQDSCPQSGAASVAAE